jgi:hypothetical protein
MSGIFLAAQHPVTEDEGANNSVVHVSRGTSVSVVLPSDYWDVEGSSRPSVLAQTGPATLLPGNCPPGVGCGQTRTTFTARDPGTATVTATRSVCGEALPCASGQEAYRFTVVVLGPPGTRRNSAGSASSR